MIVQNTAGSMIAGNQGRRDHVAGLRTGSLVLISLGLWTLIYLAVTSLI